MAFCRIALVRSFSSTNVAAAQLVKAPLQLFGMQGRYATALYSAASKQKKLDTVEGELKSIEKLFKEDKNFRGFILDPTIARSAKKWAITAIAKKLNMSDVTQNFFGIVAENGRLSKLEQLLKAFNMMMGAHRGEVTCEVITAKPLDAGLQKELDSVLQGFVKQGQKLTVHTKIDPKIIGGMIVSIGDKYVDMSIATKLQKYERSLREAV